MDRLNSPAHFVGYPSPNKPTTHPSQGKDGNCNGIEEGGVLVGHVLAIVALAVCKADELFDDGLGRIDDPRVVAELEHAQNGGKDAVAQEKCESLSQQPLLAPLSVSLQSK